MDTRTEPIKQDIDAIRDSMTEKLRAIETTVKGTVDDTQEAVRQAFDVNHQVAERPWAALGLAVAAGFVLGSLDGGSSNEYHPMHASAYPEDSMAVRSESFAPAKPGFMDQIAGEFGDEINMIKSVAVTSLIGIVRDAIRRNAPAMADQIERMAPIAANGTSNGASSYTPHAPAPKTGGATMPVPHPVGTVTNHDMAPTM